MISMTCTELENAREDKKMFILNIDNRIAIADSQSHTLTHSLVALFRTTFSEKFSGPHSHIPW